jgi:hydrogenase-4 component B
VAVCALPPLNGFASEWLLYIGLLRTLSGEPQLPAAAAAAVALAMAGALAVACFVKLLGAVFLGSPRSDATDTAQDPQASMLVPMGVLAAGCAGLGLFPLIAAPLLEGAARSWAVFGEPPAVSLTALAPLTWVCASGLALMVLVIALALAAKTLPRAQVMRAAGTWDCGYARPTARMQYTGSSFGETLVKLFAFVLWPKRCWPGIRGCFSAGAHFRSSVPDPVLDRLVLPLFRLAGRYLPYLRVLHQGQTQLYVLYVLVILIVLLVWGAMGLEP